MLSGDWDRSMATGGFTKERRYINLRSLVSLSCPFTFIMKSFLACMGGGTLQLPSSKQRMRIKILELLHVCLC